jgi:hypothetical protein
MRERPSAQQGKGLGDNGVDRSVERTAGQTYQETLSVDMSTLRTTPKK